MFLCFCKNIHVIAVSGSYQGLYHRSETFTMSPIVGVEQNEDRQMIALQKAGVPTHHIFMDKQSGKDFARANLKGTLERCQMSKSTFYRKLREMRGRPYSTIKN